MDFRRLKDVRDVRYYPGVISCGEKRASPALGDDGCVYRTVCGRVGSLFLAVMNLQEKVLRDLETTEQIPSC